MGHTREDAGHDDDHDEGGDGRREREHDTGDFNHKEAAGGGHAYGQRQEHHDLRETSRRSLVTALFLTATFMVVEAVGGFLSGSLALIADAEHMLTDSAAIALALFAIWLAKRPASAKRTYGYNRAEVLAAAANGIFLWLIAGWILWESIQRFINPKEVEGDVVVIVGGIGLLVNLVVMYILHKPSERSLNVEGALQHVFADLMSSVGVVISGIVVILSGWSLVDPILSVLIALLIMLSSRHLLTAALTVLIEGTPEHVDLYKLCSEMEQVSGVTVVHDVHAWTVTSGYLALTAHVLVDPDHRGDFDEILRELRRIANEDHGFAHTTIQLETSVDGCSEDHHFNHLLQHKLRRKRRLFAFGNNK